MPSFVIATPDSLFIVRGGAEWSIEEHLEDASPETIAVDPGQSGQLYVGTLGSGLWVSRDGGRSWEQAGIGIPHSDVTALATEKSQRDGVPILYAGTEPSTISRSEDGGRTWRVLESFLDLPSSSSWSFPPRPETHHVRCITTDPNTPGKLYVAIEAGAMVYSSDRGESWMDRVPGSPYDTHTAVTHRGASGHVYAAAGDGYFESHDGGSTWDRMMDGLNHRYLVGVAVDPGDATAVVVSAASGPYSAYHPRSAEAYVYRKVDNNEFSVSMNGLPDRHGTVASRLVADPDRPGVVFAANNHGLFRSGDGGRSWSELSIDWPAGAFRSGVNGLAVFAE